MASPSPTTRFTHTAAIGGAGGRPFTCESPGNLTRQLDVCSDFDMLHGIRITLTDGTQHTYGTMEESSAATFQFEFAEKIETLKLWKSDAHGGRSGGFRFTTNKNRVFVGGPAKGTEAQVTGGYLAGVFGRCGLDIDQLGFSFASDVVDYYLKDVEYKLVQADASGVVPTSLDTWLMVNSTQAIQKMSYTKTISTTQTKTWSSQFSIKVGVKVSGEAGVPFLAKGKVEVTGELGFSYTWGGSESSTSTQTINAGPIDVPPGKMYQVDSRADVGNITVPYTGKAVLTYEDGTKVEHDDEGRFEGIAVGRVRVEISGPLDVPPHLSDLAPGTHVAPHNDPQLPHIAAQTVVVA